MKRILNQNGFSLSDTLVAAVLLGIVGLGVMKLTDFQQASVKSSNVNLTRLMSVLREYVADPAACQANFVGKEIGGNSSFDYLVNANGQKVIEKGDVVQNGSYIVEQITLGKYRGATKHAELVVAFNGTKKIENSGISPREIKKISILVKLDSKGKTIESCVDLIDRSTDEIIEELCFDVDPLHKGNCDSNLISFVADIKKSYCESAGAFSTYDEVSGKCARLDAYKICPGGFVQGFDDKGPVCYYEPEMPGSASSTAKIEKCTAGIGKFKWGMASSSSGIIECANEVPIELAVGDIRSVAGGQPYSIGPPFLPDVRLETRGDIRVKCTEQGLIDVGSTCKPNCIIRGLNVRFPENVNKQDQCVSHPFGGSPYKFGLVMDFVSIENGKSTTLPSTDGNWLQVRCNNFGVTSFGNSKCVKPKADEVSE